MCVFLFSVTAGGERCAARLAPSPGYLRRDNLLSVDKLGVGHGLPVTFEHHDGLLGVAQVVVMDAVV